MQTPEQREEIRLWRFERDLKKAIKQQSNLLARATDRNLQAQLRVMLKKNKETLATVKERLKHLDNDRT